MVVDDEVDILNVLESGLKSNGFKVIAFSDPTEALQHFKSNLESINMVITDVRMPKMSGFQFARRIKELREEVRVILISAFEINKNEFDKVFPSTHIDGILTKPFHINELLEALAKV